MDETISWLRNRPYYTDQIQTHRAVSGRAAATRTLDLESTLEEALADQGITTLYQHQAAAIDTVRDGNNVVLATPTASSPMVRQVRITGQSISPSTRLLLSRRTTST